ncbi:MAG TPA: TonB family protein [Allosphingosinicella sp.]|jgi:TonB family protein
MTLLLALLAAAAAPPPPIVTVPVSPPAPKVVQNPAPVPFAIEAPVEAPAVRAVPKAPVERLVTVEDYPAAALRAGEQGQVRVILDIAPTGRVTGCRITASSGSAILDSSTCRLLYSRARFTPAQDAAGNAVADRFATSLTWSLNARPAVPAAIDTAMRAWLTCLQPGFAAGLADKNRSTRAVAEAAFPACTAQEDQVIAAIRAGLKQPRSAEEERASLRAQIIASIEARRTPNQR